jgi:NAD(P)-dependent dehydrogenase (short-subunit alcohol dehydrogenase family)
MLRHRRVTVETKDDAMPQKELKNKVAIVTGGTRGIGRAIAERLLDEGAHVAICGRRQKSVDDAVGDLSRKGRVFGMAADVSKYEQVQRFVAAAHLEFGAVHILINNAGAGAFASVAQLTPEMWDQMIALNLSGVNYCCHEIMPIFGQGGGGDVVNIGSLAGVNAFAGGAGYNASKFGLVGFSEAMMLDHRYDGVRVSLVMPGSVDTAFGGGASARADTGFVSRETDSGGSAVSAVAKDHPSGSEWKIAPEDIADTVVFVLKMPGRTTVSRIEVRPSRPPRKT